MLFNKIYYAFRNFGGKGLKDGFHKKSESNNALRKVSQQFLNYPELNMIDFAQFLDSRVPKMKNLLTTFYGCRPEEQESKYCSKLSELAQLHMDDVLGVMRWILQPSSLTFPKIEFDLEHGHAMPHLKYLQTDTSTITNPLLFNCDHGANIVGMNILPFFHKNIFRESIMECIAFFRSFTNAGIGYSYNTADFWDTYKSSDGLDPFFRIMRPKGNYEVFQHMSKSLNTSQEQVLRLLLGKVLHPKSSGPKYGLKLYVSSDTLDHGPIKLLLHSPYEPANIEGSALELTHGMKHTIYVTPKKITTEEDLKSLDPNDRGCLFENESHGFQRYFNNYTRQSCLFECSLAQAYESCGCIAWDFPHFKKSTKLCYRGGDMCFREFMKSPQSELSCDCPRSCNHVNYAYSVVSTPLDIYDIALCEMLYAARHPNNMRYLNQVFDRGNRRIKFPWTWVEGNLEEICQETVSQVAVINIQLTSDTITEIVRRRRVTFTDQLASLGNFLPIWSSNYFKFIFSGGVVGLFCGMSILSLVEILFWASRGLRAFLCPIPKKKKRGHLKKV